MNYLQPSRRALRILAGEGHFHYYRLLKSGRRSFLFIKFFLTTWLYFRGRGEPATKPTVAFVKGLNQLRYHHHVAQHLEREFGELQLYACNKLAENRVLPKISAPDMLLQLKFLVLMLLTGKRRYLDLYWLAFSDAIQKAVDYGLHGIKTFVCYNDQPYDVAAVIHALQKRGGCRTIVIQHGLVLNEKFYFPSVANEFWAWGEASRQHYRSWNPLAQILIKGRYIEDSHKKQEHYMLPESGKHTRILVAPSFYHEEVKEIIAILRNTLTGKETRKISVAIKFHPATKFRRLLKFLCLTLTPWLKEETAPMETLSETYDILITKNSTSAVDFLLRGKPVFFLDPHIDSSFPSLSYGFELKQLNTLLLEREETSLKIKNEGRQQFLESALNV